MSYTTTCKTLSVLSIDSIWVTGLPVAINEGRRVGVNIEIILFSIEIYEKSDTTICDYSTKILSKL